MWPIYVIEPELTESKASLICNERERKREGGWEGSDVFACFLPDLVWSNQDSILCVETEKWSICKKIEPWEDLELIPGISARPGKGKAPNKAGLSKLHRFFHWRQDLRVIEAHDTGDWWLVPVDCYYWKILVVVVSHNLGNVWLYIGISHANTISTEMSMCRELSMS